MSPWTRVKAFMNFNFPRFSRIVLLTRLREQSPASEPLAITVGNTNFMDQLASSSNFGPCVDVRSLALFFVQADVFNVRDERT